MSPEETTHKVLTALKTKTKKGRKGDEGAGTSAEAMSRKSLQGSWEQPCRAFDGNSTGHRWHHPGSQNNRDFQGTHALCSGEGSSTKNRRCCRHREGWLAKGGRKQRGKWPAGVPSLPGDRSAPCHGPAAAAGLGSCGDTAAAWSPAGCPRCCKANAGCSPLAALAAGLPADWHQHSPPVAL